MVLAPPWERRCAACPSDGVPLSSHPSPPCPPSREADAQRAAAAAAELGGLAGAELGGLAEAWGAQVVRESGGFLRASEGLAGAWGGGLVGASDAAQAPARRGRFVSLRRSGVGCAPRTRRLGWSSSARYPSLTRSGSGMTGEPRVDFRSRPQGRRRPAAASSAPPRAVAALVNAPAARSNASRSQAG